MLVKTLVGCKLVGNCYPRKSGTLVLHDHGDSIVTVVIFCSIKMFTDQVILNLRKQVGSYENDTNFA